MKKRNKIKDRRKNKENFLFKHYSLSWAYIRESKGYILFIILVLLVGFLIALSYKPPEVIELIKKFVEQILKDTQGLSLWEMIIYILNNNLKNCFFSMILGVFIGIFPFFTALINGYVLGFVSEKAVRIDGIFVLWKLFPHGILEFPAVILALALGTKLGMFIFSRDKEKEFLRRLENSLRVFLFVILPLLVIAAVIEASLILAFG